MRHSRGGSGRVVPRTGVRTMLLGIYSHGWFAPSLPKARLAAAYASIPCDLCEHTHPASEDPIAYNHPHCSLATSEWYCHFPYPAPKISIDLYYGLAATAEHRRPYDPILVFCAFSSYNTSNSPLLIQMRPAFVFPLMYMCPALVRYYLLYWQSLFQAYQV